MDCIGCKNFYYGNDGSGQCDMPYEYTCLKNNFQFKENYPRGLRTTADIVDDYLVEDKNISNIYLRENLEGTPQSPPF